MSKEQARLLRQAREAVEKLAVEETRSNMAPTGLPKRHKWSDLLKEIDKELRIPGR